MKLIGTYLSPYARRVAAALVSRAIPYAHEDLNGYADPARARALNPVGKVPILELDDGERLIDSAAILDYLDELAGADALVPRAGPARRTALRLAAIATTLCEKITLHWFERQRPSDCSQPDLLEHTRLQIAGGFAALDAAAGGDRPIRVGALDVATISAVVAFEYAQRFLDFDPAPLAPALARVAATLADEAPFRLTRPAAA